MVDLLSVQLRDKGELMRRLTMWVATISLVCGAAMMAIPSAQAATGVNICGNGGTGYCINAWNGGPYVKMYYGGNIANDQFYLSPQSVCQGDAYVMAVGRGDPINCPFNNVSYDNQYEGDVIVSIDDYGGNSAGECVGTGNLNGAPDVGYLGSCGNNFGNGLIQGGLFIETTTSNCNGMYNGENRWVLINRYWTNQDLQPAYAYSGGNPGQPLYVGATGNGTCWGGSGNY
jgi:hypothetical protein